MAFGIQLSPTFIIELLELNGTWKVTVIFFCRFLKWFLLTLSGQLQKMKAGSPI
jgi:hypothetical protein